MHDNNRQSVINLRLDKSILDEFLQYKNFQVANLHYSKTYRDFTVIPSEAADTSAVREYWPLGAAHHLRVTHPAVLAMVRLVA